MHHFFNIVLPYLDAPALDLLETTNKELKKITQNYTSTFLKKTGLFGFMKSIKESDISRLVPGIRAQLLLNPINHAIPQQYISKYMKQIVLNDGIPYKVFSTWGAFCAISDDGALVAWGNPDTGGTTPAIPDGRTVRSVYSTGTAFCALLNDGSLVAWGGPDFGGTTPAIPDGRTVKSVYSTNSAFCAILNDGSLVTWGHPNEGGTNPTINENQSLAFFS